MSPFDGVLSDSVNNNKKTAELCHSWPVHLGSDRAWEIRISNSEPVYPLAYCECILPQFIQVDAEAVSKLQENSQHMGRPVEISLPKRKELLSLS